MGHILILLVASSACRRVARCWRRCCLRRPWRWPAEFQGTPHRSAVRCRAERTSGRRTVAAWLDALYTAGLPIYTKHIEWWRRWWWMTLNIDS